MTVDEELVAPGDPERVAYVVEHLRVAQRGRSGVTPGDELRGLRVLDLAARTGRFSIALAEAGAKVTAVEGREENYSRIPAHLGIRKVLGDVRDLIPRKRGREARYGVALCLGLLYHLGPADAVGLLRALRRIVEPGGFVIIDTHISTRRHTVEVDGVTYHGHWYTEWPGLWSSIGNPRAWWFTEDSLYRAARDAGWERFDAIEGARYAGEPSGRLWVVLS